MRIDSLRVSKFRNLDDFFVDFAEQRFATVMIGENGAGKSNILEALILIFRDLDLGAYPTFDYVVRYRCRDRDITVRGTRGERQLVSVDGGDGPERLTWSKFQQRKDSLLPKYVFAYYSGSSTRMRSYFDAHQKRFYDTILDDDSGDPPPIRRLFYCLPEHSRWVLLAYFLRGSSAPELLSRYFGIDSFDSALLVLRRPEWSKSWGSGQPPPSVRARGDERFWYARGVVKTFLDRLWSYSLAPVLSVEDFLHDYRARPVAEERTYLYLPDVDSVQELRTDYPDEAALFAALESADISQMVRDVRIRVMRNGESILFSEMSEGEQQLLTVVGLMHFTRHEESLFLLDEPDTHLNPKWKLRYLEELSRHAGLPVSPEDDEDTDEPSSLDPTSQLIMTTHDPLTIAGLLRSQVQVLQRDGNRVQASVPVESPRGLGVAGVLLEMFNLPSTLDRVTQGKIDRRNALAHKECRSESEATELLLLAEQLAALGLAYEARDPDYRAYLKAVHDWERRNASRLERLSEKEQRDIVSGILSDLRRPQ